MAKAVFRATVRSRGLAGRFQRGAERLEPWLEDELVDDTAPGVQEIFRDWAPELTGRLRAGIEVRPYSGGRIGFEVTATAVQPRDGFNYVDVTRYGHRKARIYPTKGDRIRFHSMYGFGYVNVASVRGHKPAADWALAAYPEVLDRTDQAAADLARRIDTRILG